MIRHFFILLFRQFLHNKLYMLIKLLGLAVGMAVSLMIMLYILHELSFDRFHGKKEEIYNVVVESHRKGIVERSAQITAAVGPSLQEEFPEIESTCRFSIFGRKYFNVNGKSLLLNEVGYADSTLFDMFSFSLMRGNKERVLHKPFRIVLTESAADKLFPEKDPVGQIIRLGNEQPLTVTGIMQDPPENSHLQFDALISFSTLYEYENIYLGWDGGWGYHTYVHVNENINWDHFGTKLVPFLEKHINKKYRNFGVEIKLRFDKLKNVYLFSSAQGSQPLTGNFSEILIFGAVALFILLIAAINFMNLSTARYSKRAREVGVRKVLGAERGHLRRQFLAESVIISLIALLLATVLVEIFLPAFNHFIDKSLGLYKDQWYIFPVLIFVAVLAGLLSGSYPAIFLSAFKPARVIKGQLTTQSNGLLRNILVVFQFFISSVLIIATITIYRQLNYMYSKRLGYDKENVLVLDLLGNDAKNNYEILKNEIKKLSYVKNASASSQLPVWGLTRNGYVPEGLEEPIMIHVLDVDEDYFETMNIPVLAGESFRSGSQTDNHDYMINKALADKMNWENPLGKTIFRNRQHRVIGMTDNFHYAPMYHEIEPLIFTNKPYLGFDYLSIKLLTSDYEMALSEIEKIWHDVLPGSPFKYSFLNQALYQSYGSVEQFGNMFTAFAVLAIFIACLGLFGLASYLTEQRRKEIGIRKTFGADVSRIVWMLGTDFTKMVVLGNLIAWPVAWLIMQYWLENFAYSAPLRWWIFLVSLIVSLSVAVITVAWKSVRAAGQNPADIIRYE